MYGTDLFRGAERGRKSVENNTKTLENTLKYG
jgi:hypothetical protein